MLFTVDEARAFEGGKLADTSTYPDADIQAMAELVGDLFAQICGVRFEPTTETDERADGTGTDQLWVKHHRLQSVTACSIYSPTGQVLEELDPTALADLAVYPEGKIVRLSRGIFAWGRRNVKLTYVHGWAITPPAVKRAALRLALDELVASDISSRVTQMADGDLRYSFSVPGRGKTEWTGIPVVDTVLRTYNETLVGLVR